MKLIGMVDFVLEHHDSNLDLMVDYANFLKQPLKLEMFVPCDNEGNVLEEPLNWQDGSNCIYLDNKRFEQAKVKVLFLSFISEDFDRSLARVYIDEYFNIEQLSNEIRGIQLTDSAIKQIGL